MDVYICKSAASYVCLWGVLSAVLCMPMCVHGSLMCLWESHQLSFGCLRAVLSALIYICKSAASYVFLWEVFCAVFCIPVYLSVLSAA
jgi:hypothetical protein